MSKFSWESKLWKGTHTQYFRNQNTTFLKKLKNKIGQPNPGVFSLPAAATL